MTQERIEIKLSKSKGILGFAGSAAFVAASVWLIDFAYNQNRFNPIIVTIVGYAGVIFFSLTALYIFYKLFDTKPGLIIDNDGIYDNSSAASGHLIKWERIIGLRVEQIASTKLLLIDIKDPELFIEDATGIKKRLLQSTYKMYGTPTSIASTSLSCSFDELFQIINARLINKSQDRNQ